mmetsp:Transcript_24405/g.82339  ORF Transcript_24405/g.82339 Transcript_24405/m.82339 type:complete len:164 (-) Transcript_24405:63-554(-)
MLTFTVARSPWEREVSAFIFEACKNLCNGTDEEVHRFQTQMLSRGDHNRDRAHPLFFGPSSAYSGGLANYAIRTESLRAGANEIAHLLGVEVPPSLRVPTKKYSTDEKTHVESTGGVDHWYRGCCACVDKVARWYAEDLSWFGYPRPECDGNRTGTDENCKVR